MQLEKLYTDLKIEILFNDKFYLSLCFQEFSIRVIKYIFCYNFFSNRVEPIIVTLNDEKSKYFFDKHIAFMLFSDDIFTTTDTLVWSLTSLLPVGTLFSSKAKQ